MKLLNEIVIAAVLFAIITAPTSNMLAAYITQGVLDSPTEDVYQDTNSSYQESRDLSAYIKPAIAVGTVAVVATVIALASSGGGGRHHKHHSDLGLASHSHD